jgi:hypothetical protein
MKRSNKLQGEEYFRKRIEKRLLDCIFRTQFQKALVFRFSRKTQTFCEKDNPDDLIGAACKGIENSLSLQLVASVNSNFLKPLQGNRRYYGHFQRAGCWIFVFQKSVGFRVLGKFDGTSKKFGLSLMIRIHKVNFQL